MTLTVRLRDLWVRSGRVLACVMLLAMTVPAVGLGDEEPAQLLDDFVHYTKIGSPDLARAYGQALLEAGLSNAELAVLAEENIDAARLESALQLALRKPDLEDIAAEIGLRIETGRLDLAREGERIERAIQMLVGTQRQQRIARDRLQAAGEYAVPLLLEQITDGHDDRLGLACFRMLAGVRRQAVTPLCEALPSLDPVSQRTVCDILGEIGYPHAAPYLRELAIDESADIPSRDAAARAFSAVGGVDLSLTKLYAGLGEDYYSRMSSLVAYPYEDTNNVWEYDSHIGLVAQSVPTDIYAEVMAMRMARKALALDRSNRRALGLWVASDLKRENDLPAGESDPVFGDKEHGPEFYATVYGTQICLDVLARAIDTKDTPLVRDAISALSQTTGGSNLFTGPGGAGGRQPLLEAISYPDRRTQYEAALTLGRAIPRRGFQGDFRIVPLLASAVRTGNQSFALVVADDSENRQQEVGRLEDLGYTIVGSEERVGALTGAIAEAVGVDIVVIRVNASNDAKQALAELRAHPKTSAAPVLILASAVDFAALDRAYRLAPAVKVSKSLLDDVVYHAVVNDLLERAVGGRISEAEAEIYAIEALSAMERIAISGTPAYDIADAENALVEALAARSGGARMLVADILALIDTDRAQRALFDGALTATSDEQVELLDRVAESVKRWGDRSEPRHIANVIDLITNADPDTADAAARVHGALNLPITDAIDLILQTD